MVFINAMMIVFTILAGRKAILNRYRRMVRMILFPSALFGPVAIITSLALPMAGVGWVPPLVHILFGILTIFIGLALLRFRMLSIEPAFVIERLFFDITDMVVLTDMDGVIRKSNQALSNQANLFPEPLAGKPLSVILPEVELRGQVIYRAPQKVVFETNLRLPSGETLPVRGALSVVDDIHADPVGYYFLLHDLRDMRKIAQYAADLEQTNQKLELVSKTDGLTGIWNRAKFNEMLQNEFERFKRYGDPFSIILFDIDKFKLINDTCGHLGGDEVLKQVVEKVKPAIRGTDIFARWGGDEFAVLSPHLDTGGIALVAERIRRAVASISVNEMGVTASIGMTIVTHHDTITVLFERADAAIYSAKEQGGNCFVLG
jgi:diguanylate cyclase (GGDEF)-like protein